MTDRERIKSMNHRELAEMIINKIIRNGDCNDCHRCPMYDDCDGYTLSCEEVLEVWLKSKVKVDTPESFEKIKEAVNLMTDDEIVNLL